MGDASWCSKCGAFIYASGHRCPPKWRIWSTEQNEEDAHETYGYDASTAVEAWAEYDDQNSAEYDIAHGNGEVEVYVVPADAPPGTKGKRYSVRGEYEPVYYATELDAPEEEPDGTG